MPAPIPSRKPRTTAVEGDRPPFLLHFAVRRLSCLPPDIGDVHGLLEEGLGSHVSTKLNWFRAVVPVAMATRNLRPASQTTKGLGRIPDPEPGGIDRPKVRSRDRQ